MVQKLLQSSTNSHERDRTDASEENLATTVTSSSSSTTTTATANPPFESCHVSGELSPEDYISVFSAELTRSQPKSSWSRKLKLINQSSLSLKLKASKAYLKSLFTTKSGCSDDSNASMKAENCSTGYLKADKENPFAQSRKERWLMTDTNTTTLMRSIERKKLLEEECIHRKSFSGAINCYLTPGSSPAISSCSSSSSSFSSVNSNRFYGSQMLNRSSSVNSEMESSIQGAIAYCKKSQVSARKSVSDVDFCSLSASKIVAACENQERPGLCRG